MGFLKTFASDMSSAGKTAARGMGNMADQFSDDPKVRKRALAERKKMDQEQKAGSPKIPHNITYNGTKYTIGGTFGTDLTKSKRYATALEKNNGFKTVIKKIKSPAYGTIYTVYYASVTVRKAVKVTKTAQIKPRKAKKVIKKKPRSDDWW